MTEDHVEKKNIEGGLDQAKGKIKEVAGAATGDRDSRARASSNT